MAETIFLSIASVEDTEIVETVRCAMESAENPERVFIGVYLLDSSKVNYKKLLKLKDRYPNISLSYEKLIKNSISQLGVGRGRYNAQSLYSDQDYFMQVDAHTWLLDGWDSYMIKLFKDAKAETGNDLTVITRIPAYYNYSDYGVKRSLEPVNLHPYTAYSKMEISPGRVPKWSQFPVDFEKYPNRFYPAVKANSACSFGDKNFAKDTGIRPYVMYYEEDVIMSIELYGRGFSLVFPNVDDFPVYHLNYTDINKFGGKRKFFSYMISDKLQKEVTLKIKENFSKYLNDSTNFEKIKQYETYANVLMKFGGKSNYKIPENYRLNKEYYE